MSLSSLLKVPITSCNGYLILICQADRFFYIDDGPLFETLPHVIDHYSKSADGLPVLLKMAVPPTGHPPINIAHRAAMPTGYPVHTGRPTTPTIKSIPAATTGGSGSPKQLPRTKSMVCHLCTGLVHFLEKPEILYYPEKS